MQYGFVIDHESCIGCHACTVACKSENDVPVGAFRTSVKYTEHGTFPAVKRSFLVQRCNHCTDAPCVTICPVTALDKRPDGIVDIDRDACIGCRACMQACPYDAIYLNEDSGAVEKCHFCAHRVERGLEPACVVVCPTESIIAGDLDSSDSKVSLLVQNNRTQVRSPEQGTGPNVHYKDADPISLHPGAAARPETYIWSNRPPDKPEPWPASLTVDPTARVVLDSGHKVEWGWPVAAYLVTKGIAAGVAMLAPFAVMSRVRPGLTGYLPEIIALLFTAITCVLLVEDLARPKTFYRMVTRPNWKSWLVKGGVILSAFMGMCALIMLARWSRFDTAADTFRAINVLLGAAVAGYTAFLFAQCKGRDLWESPLLLPHLLVQALMCGAVVLLPFARHAWDVLPDGLWVLRAAALVGLAGHVALALLEVREPHSTTNANQAAAFLGEIRIGTLNAFRDGLLICGIGTVAMLILLPGLALVPALLGLAMYEHAFIRAGQLPPLS